MLVSELVTLFFMKKGLPVPSTFWAPTDTGSAQIYALFLEEIRELGKNDFPEQKIEKTFTTVAAEAQGSVYTIFGADFSYLIAATAWDTTLRRPLFGPVGDTSWANLQAFPASGPIYQYKVFGNTFNIFPAPPAGDTIYAIYQSTYGITNTGGTPIAAPSASTDIMLLPPEVVLRGWEYRWEREKGLLSWQNTYIEYTDLKAKALQRTGMPNVHLDNARFKLSPGIWVPAGDWPH